jgi:CheY-like chemotaxis protein/HPt (histidine-containing phosphotransfer) domain-containing protein
LQTLLNDILDFSKVEAGKVELVESPTSPHELIQEVHDLYSELAKTKQINLQQVWLGPKNQYYLSDPTRLRQMLSNFVNNAIKFTDEGFVRIGAKEISREGNQAILEFAVTDTGMGISDEDQKLLFQSFSQVNLKLQSVQAGSGLGLSIVANLVKLMHGKYGISSTLGKGSTFWFRIPVQCLVMEDSKIFDAQDDVKRELKFQACRILLVEDNLTNRIVLSSMIGSIDSEIMIDEVENGQLAVDAYIKNRNYDLILMDIQLPVMDGIEASRKIRDYEIQRGLKKVPIIAVTAYAYAEDRSKYLSLGMDFLAKPIEFEQLQKTLMSWLTIKSERVITLKIQEQTNEVQIFDKESMLQRLGGDRRLALSIIQSTMNEMPKFIDQLYTLQQEGDWVGIKSITHTLKGLIKQVGGDYLADKIAQLDYQLKMGEYFDDEVIRTIEKDYYHLLEEMMKEDIIRSTDFNQES